MNACPGRKRRSIVIPFYNRDGMVFSKVLQRLICRKDLMYRLPWLCYKRGPTSKLGKHCSCHTTVLPDNKSWSPLPCCEPVIYQNPSCPLKEPQWSPNQIQWAYVEVLQIVWYAIQGFPDDLAWIQHVTSTSVLHKASRLMHSFLTGLTVKAKGLEPRDARTLLHA